MPLVEAVSLLSALANAYQVIRGNRTAGESAAVRSEPVAPSLVLAYDFVRAAAEGSFERVDSVRSQLQGLIALSGLTVVGAPAILRISNANPDLDSALFLAALVAFGFIAAIATLVRSLAPPRQALPGEIYQKYATEPDQLLDRMLSHASEVHEHNLRLIELGRQALKLLSFLLVVQIVALAIWIPVEF